MWSGRSCPRHLFENVASQSAEKLEIKAPAPKGAFDLRTYGIAEAMP
jgi:hypothetical protein